MALADGGGSGGHGGGHGTGGGHSVGHSPGHASGGHASGGHAGRGSGGHDAGLRGLFHGIRHGGFARDAHRESPHRGLNVFRQHGRSFLGYRYVSSSYAQSYDRGNCNPYSVYFDPAYCARYYPSSFLPGWYYGPVNSGAANDPAPDDVIRDGVAVRVPLQASPDAPDSLP